MKKIYDIECCKCGFNEYQLTDLEGEWSDGMKSYQLHVECPECGESGLLIYEGADRTE